MNIQPPTMPNLQVQETLKSAGDTISNTVNVAKTNFNESVSGFSQQAQAGATASQGFLQSNTIIAKFAFIILVVIVFLFLMSLGIMLIMYFTTPSTSPYVVKGKTDASTSKIISTDPTQNGSVPIVRSNNQAKGLEFTWSFWIYINDLGDGKKAQNIFNKGDRTYDSNGIATTNGPGLYLVSGATPITSKNSGVGASLEIIMDTNDPNVANNTVMVSNIPIRKWAHIAVRMQNTIMDIYVNGIVTQRKIFDQVPKQNFYDINLFQNGGFSGNLSNLRYYSYALNAFEINSILYYGPNLAASSLDNSASGNYTYLSNKWYASNLQ